MTAPFASWTRPGTQSLSVSGCLAFGWFFMWMAIILITIDDRVMNFLGWMMTVPAASLLLIGSIATGIRMAREEEAESN